MTFRLWGSVGQTVNGERVMRLFLRVSMRTSRNHPGNRKKTVRPF